MIERLHPELKASLWNLGVQTIRELETEHGILASAKEEIYGCVFGRDSLITSLQLLRVYEGTGESYFLELVKKILSNLVLLQGSEVIIESGEEPGKCIHEYRPDNHEHLTKYRTPAWCVYPDNAMRNYDSVDATPLLLVAVYRVYETTADDSYLSTLLPHIRSALQWMVSYGDSNNDGLIDYRFHPNRTSGGLITQSWMDSVDSAFHEDGVAVRYPIAPVEVQAYAYVAFRMWAQYFRTREPFFSSALELHARGLRDMFAERFVLNTGDAFSMAFAIDGNGKPMVSPRSSQGHCLWAAWKPEGAVELDCILDPALVPRLVERMLAPDLFEPRAGIRTLSTTSTRFNANSYHNGSIWPHDTSMVAEGMYHLGFVAEASRVRRALVHAVDHFQTPVELFVYANKQYAEYRSPRGQAACKKQAWSAASLLSAVSHL